MPGNGPASTTWESWGPQTDARTTDQDETRQEGSCWLRQLPSVNKCKSCSSVTNGFASWMAQAARQRNHSIWVEALKLHPWHVTVSGKEGNKAWRPVGKSSLHSTNLSQIQKRWYLLSEHSQYGQMSEPSCWQCCLASCVMWVPFRHFCIKARSQRDKDCNQVLVSFTSTNVTCWKLGRCWTSRWTTCSQAHWTRRRSSDMQESNKEKGPTSSHSKPFGKTCHPKVWMRVSNVFVILLFGTMWEPATISAKTVCT